MAISDLRKLPSWVLLDTVGHASGDFYLIRPTKYPASIKIRIKERYFVSLSPITNSVRLSA